MESVERGTGGDLELRDIRQEQEQNDGQERVEGLQGADGRPEESETLREEAPEVL